MRLQSPAASIHRAAFGVAERRILVSLLNTTEGVTESAGLYLAAARPSQ
jgi:hypothetical protein